MPISDLHKRKKVKNFLVLGLIFAWMILIWFVTMVRIANAQEMPLFPPQPDVRANAGNPPSIDYDLDKMFGAQRAAHNEAMAEQQDGIYERNDLHQVKMDKQADYYKRRNMRHLRDIADN